MHRNFVLPSPDARYLLLPFRSLHLPASATQEVNMLVSVLLLVIGTNSTFNSIYGVVRVVAGLGWVVVNLWLGRCGVVTPRGVCWWQFGNGKRIGKCNLCQFGLSEIILNIFKQSLWLFVLKKGFFCCFFSLVFTPRPELKVLLSCAVMAMQALRLTSLNVTSNQ